MNERPTPPRPRRTPRLGDSGAPVTTIVVLALAAVAVIAGFIILRSVGEPAEGPDEVATGAVATTGTTAPASTTSPATTTTSTSTTTTTTIPAAKTDATVIVANASGINGTATAMDAALDAAGYVTGEVANSTGPRLDDSIIYFVGNDTAALGVARLLAQQIPTANTVPMPAQPPIDRSLGGATVALLLGTDAAGRSLAELASD